MGKRDSSTRRSETQGEDNVGLTRLLEVLDSLHRLYPQIEAWLFVRSSGAGGGAGRLAVPVNLAALDFVAGSYWVGEHAPDEVSEFDPQNYQPGFKRTVLGLEAAVRMAFGLGGVQRGRGEYSGHGVDPRVVDALTWMRSVAFRVADEQPLLAFTIRREAGRIIARCNAMMLGSRFEGTRNPCAYCHEVDSVVADEDRAVCVNPLCRDADGGRRCWRYDPDRGEWYALEEPDRRGRGRLSEEEYSRWVAEADPLNAMDRTG